MTYSNATLELSMEAYDEIYDKLKAAGYGPFSASGVIGMNGIEISREVKAIDCLFGSNTLSSNIELSPTLTVTLGDVVRVAFTESGLTVAEWNAIPEAMQDSLLNSAILTMKNEAYEASTIVIEVDNDMKDVLLHYFAHNFPDTIKVLKK